MELCVKNGTFEMMSQDEMMEIDGGGFLSGAAAFLIGLAGCAVYDGLKDCYNESNGNMISYTVSAYKGLFDVLFD